MESKIKALLIDIEGTTSSLSNVKDVMFPYSKQRLRDFLSKHWQEERVSSIIRKLEERLGKRIDLEEAGLRLGRAVPAVTGQIWYVDDGVM